MTDSRGTSITVTYSLTVAVSSLLIMGLLLSAGGMLDRQQEDAIREQLQDLNTRVTSELFRADQLASTMTWTDNIELRTDLPITVAGTGYRIRLVSGPPQTVYLNSTSSQISVQVEIDTETDICPSTATGGQLTVVYDATQDCLTLEQ